MTLMDMTITMDNILNLLHSIPLTTSNKQWLADHLYEEVMAEKKATDNAAAGWPKVSREDLQLSPDVMKLVEDIEPLPDSFDYDKAKFEYLMTRIH